MRNLDAVVIGAGPSGSSAAIQLQRLGRRIALVDRSGEPGGLLVNARSVENLPVLAQPTDGPTLVRHIRANLERFGIPVHTADVGLVHKRPDGLFELFDRERQAIFETTAVIAAIGTEAKRIKLDGQDELGPDRVFHEVRAALDSRRPLHGVAVVGGGEAACDYALSLADLDVSVHLLVRGTSLRARGRLARQARKHPRVHLHVGSAVRAVSEQGRTMLVRLHEGDGTTSIEVDVILIAIGRTPSRLDVRLADTEPIDIAQAARHTDGLWLVGDARNGSLGQAGMAVGDGQRAAQQVQVWLEKTRCRS